MDLSLGLGLSLGSVLCLVFGLGLSYGLAKVMLRSKWGWVRHLSHGVRERLALSIETEHHRLSFQP